MEEINEYKKRFFSLLETKMGDVKPLITEADLATVEVVASQKFITVNNNQTS